MAAVCRFGLVVRVFGPPTEYLVVFVVVQNVFGIDLMP